MTPLDLTKHPPRGPRERLGGLVVLARSVDKLRAALPGGNLGEYLAFDGMSKRFTDRLGIDIEQLGRVVGEASGEDEVVAWVRAHTDPSEYDRINEDFEGAVQSRVSPERRARLLTNYPKHLLDKHEKLMDLLEADDREAFPER